MVITPSGEIPGIGNSKTTLFVKIRYKYRLRNTFPTDFPDDAAIKSAMLEQSALQHTFSSCIDSHTLNSLLNYPALPTREKARLRAVSAVGAARWLSAAPNFKNFKYFESNQFSVALRYWLGIPIFNSTCKCRCGQIIDVFGDHATTCKVGGGPIQSITMISSETLFLNAVAWLE